ncbi:hypothetical protein CONCODRAFT_10039 [Conidiobolus coronatus NRRL 28638]|uniref:DNA-directed DNA polymerase n=1 Tax=Conidiobolus coronatus (strain ATCC 28846 / CBS 209.66 / NRRL 28638) TaxID=796925 RepID=A0A137NYN1_CONC2|nr:hypothetical protein CONCODRAFT_10039 [Conidiobolus coronatus NRRL 28638]|eukprot:KXN67852.1 hypothetical protein CONCODRAFT_10039 [Conidiobolus coronatus NRRL 28638]
MKFEKKVDILKKLTNTKIEEYATVASLSFKTLKKTLSKDIVLPIETDNDVDDFIRKSIIGGRAQVYKGGIQRYQLCRCVRGNIKNDWEESREGLFDKYFHSLKEEKKKQDRLKSSSPNIYNPVLGEFCKLMMNSLSGKVAERKRRKFSKLLVNDRDVDRFDKQTIDGSVRYHFGQNYLIGEGYA